MRLQVSRLVTSVVGRKVSFVITIEKGGKEKMFKGEGKVLGVPTRDELIRLSQEKINKGYPGWTVTGVRLLS